MSRLLVVVRIYGWMSEGVPKESLTFTLETTRKALLKNVR